MHGMKFPSNDGVLHRLPIIVNQYRYEPVLRKLLVLRDLSISRPSDHRSSHWLAHHCILNFSIPVFLWDVDEETDVPRYCGATMKRAASSDPTKEPQTKRTIASTTTTTMSNLDLTAQAVQLMVRGAETEKQQPLIVQIWRPVPPRSNDDIMVYDGSYLYCICEWIRNESSEPEP
jgi:hypothetical protein